jgi:uracil-DNA glycosylase
MTAVMDDFDQRLMPQQIVWAHTYNGYERLAGGESGPLALAKLLEPARREFRESGQIPEWCGVDLLRGWAFYLARADHFGDSLSAGSAAVAEWQAVLSTIAGHPSNEAEDRPPLPTSKVALPAGPFSTEPRSHRDTSVLEAKQHRWFEPHVAPINLLVQEISRTVGGDVPYVDPDCGGVGARVLLLLEAPAGAAAHGSGMLSADNDDGTAANVWTAYQHSGLPRQWVMHWNAVPWYIGVPGKIRAATRQDVHDGRDWLFRVVDLMPELRVVLTLGNSARDAVEPVKVQLESRGLYLLSAKHPSQRVINFTKGVAREEIHAAFVEARALAEPLRG